MKYINTTLMEWLQSIGLSAETSKTTLDFMWFTILIVLALVSFYITRRVLLEAAKQWVKNSKTHWDDVLVKHRFFRKLSLAVPVIIINYITPYVLEDYPLFTKFIQTACNIYIIFVMIFVLNSFFRAVEEIYNSTKMARRRPIKSYLQVVQIVIYIIAGIIIISSLLDKSPTVLLGGLGAMSAVLMLVFKDSILGFVGGLQLSANKMVLPGDWISMPKFGADGVVQEITLVTVKVQNWDKTITTIPTYNLITDPVTNWRGMEESGGRRIKRSLMIDMQSIKFCTPEMLQKFSSFHLLKSYIAHKEDEIKKFNETHKLDDNTVYNGRRQTNIGVFRAYLEKYLRNRKDIHQDMTFLVRQLQPTEKGLPMEIYVFSRIQAWAEYEAIQADIFDHILAILPEFELSVYQYPTGKDLARVGRVLGVE